MAPLKPSVEFFTSGEPRMLSAGILQSSNTIMAVSEQRMPILFSTLMTFMPGVRASTTKDLIPARPAFLSTVAQTTTKPSDFSPAIRPEVQ